MRPGCRRLATATAAALAALLAIPTSPASAAPGEASLSGRVTAEDTGSPLGGVCVTAYGDVEVEPDVRTAADGTYTVAGLDAGTYDLVFNDCDEPRDGYVPELLPDLVELADAEDRTGLDVALAPAGAIEGTVRGDDGAALAGICVSAIASGPGAGFGFAETGPDGGYRIGNVGAGRYHVVFEDCDEDPQHVAEVFRDRTLLGFDDLEQGEEVTVATGRTTSGVDAALALGGAVRGQVFTEHTGLPALACVAIWPPTGAAILVPVVSEDGSFTVGGLPRGTYEVELSSPVCDDGYVPEDLGGVFVDQGETTDVGPHTLSASPSTTFACLMAEPTDGFPDVDPASVHAEAVGCVAGLDVARGGTDGRYRPADAVHRDQMASFIARSLEAVGVELPPAPPDAFPDDAGNTHEPAINALAELGIVSGREGRYEPGRRVTREQMAAFLTRAYELATTYQLRVVGDRFPDDGSSTFAREIDEAAAAGLVAGRADGSYGPGGPVTREQMATFLARLVDRVFRDAPLP